MKNISASLLVFLLLICGHAVIAQEEDYPYYNESWKDSVERQRRDTRLEVKEEKRKRTFEDEVGSFKLALNAGFGVINSAEINNFIRNDLNSQGIQIIEGNSDMNLAYIIGGQLYYVITPKLQAKAILDYAIGISYTEVIGQAQDITYTASRLSVGIGANYYFGSKLVMPYGGGAILYHSLGFEGFKGNTIGPRAEGGVRFNFKENFKMETFLQVDFAEAESRLMNQSMHIDFSSVNVCARLLLKI